MSDKFKYAPGKPGFGSKGDNGINGNQGLSMYFTDFDPITQSSLINLKIENNYIIRSGIDISLPDGRVYVTGDLFFDSKGKCYEINAENNNFTAIIATLNTEGYFVPLGISSNNGFARYFNSNSGTKYIIDNVYAISGAIDYTQVPNSIYGIVPVDFTRIEYTDVKPGAGIYNPFTVYSSGETAGVDDNKGLALVFESETSTFHLGNLDDAHGNLRNTNLTFDVSLLIHTKQPGNYFTSNTPNGAILTNYEIAANSLFDPNFNSAPSSFYATVGITDASLYWNLLDFTNDTDVTGDLYFYENFTPYQGVTVRIDSSAARPLVFSNIPTTGGVRVTGLSNAKTYASYMKLHKNGWTRDSNILNIFAGTIDVTPDPWPTDVSWGSSTDSSTLVFTVSANNIWGAAITVNPSTFLYNLVCVSTAGSYDGSIYVDVSSNNATSRTGVIRATVLGGAYDDVSITQAGPITLVSVTATHGSETPLGGTPSDNYASNIITDTIEMKNYPNGLKVDFSIDTSFNIKKIDSYVYKMMYDFGLALKDKNGIVLASDRKHITSFINAQSMGLPAVTLNAIDVSYGDLPLYIDVSVYGLVGSGTPSQQTYIHFNNIYLNPKITYKSGPSVSIINDIIPSTLHATVNYIF